MSDELISENICIHDPRSELYAYLKMCDDEWQDAPPEGCGSCENCFYGRHKLASTIAALQQQGEAVAWLDDAKKYGDALNNAGWTFLEACPEKSALLFNNVKPALRAAIIRYGEQVSRTHPSKPVVSDEDLRWLEDIADDLKNVGGPTNNMRLVALTRAISALGVKS